MSARGSVEAQLRDAVRHVRGATMSVESGQIIVTVNASELAACRQGVRNMLMTNRSRRETDELLIHVTWRAA